MCERLTVQFARGPRRGDGGNNPFPSNERNNAPRPRRTPHRMQITGLPSDTSWQVCELSPAPFPTDTHTYLHIHLHDSY